MKPLTEAHIIIREHEGGRMEVDVEMRPEVDLRRKGGLFTGWGRCHKAAEMALAMLRGVKHQFRNRAVIDTTDPMSRDIFKKG